MTSVIVIMLGAGVLLVINALDGPAVPLVSTLQAILAGRTLDVSGTAGQSSNNVPIGNGAGGSIPSTTQGQRTAQGYPETASEWPVGQWFGGVIKACVETSGAIAAKMLGRGEDTPAAIAADVSEMTSQGWASYGGASNFYGEQKFLREQGIATTLYPVSNTSVAQQTIIDSLNRGVPVMVGNSQAYHLVDMLSGTRWNDQPGHRVYGHAFTIEKANDQGVWVGDPNTPSPGKIVFYTWPNLWQSQVNQLLIPT